VRVTGIGANHITTGKANATEEVNATCSTALHLQRLHICFSTGGLSECSKNSGVVGLKKLGLGDRKLQFANRQLQISNRGDYGCSKFQFRPLIPPKCGLPATNKFSIFERKFFNNKEILLKFRSEAIAPAPPCHDATVKMNHIL